MSAQFAAPKIDFDQLPLCVGIVGSRDFPRLDVVNAFVHRLHKNTEVVSGGARGVDRAAVTTAKARGLGWREFLPDESIPIPARFFMRNTEIVEYVQSRQGIVVAFSLTPTTSGTRDTLSKCDRHDIPYLVFNYASQGTLVDVTKSRKWSS
jgi:hypothetical protein